MSPEYKIKTILEKDDEHLEQYDKVVYETTQDFTSVETMLAKFGVQAFSLSSLKKTILDSMMHYMPNIHAILYEMHISGTLVDVFTELATYLEEADYTAFLSTLFAGFAIPDFADLVDSLGWSVSDMLDFIRELENFEGSFGPYSYFWKELGVVGIQGEWYTSGYPSEGQDGHTLAGVYSQYIAWYEQFRRIFTAFFDAVKTDGNENYLKMAFDLLESELSWTTQERNDFLEALKNDS